jgi:hypothetical protein
VATKRKTGRDLPVNGPKDTVDIEHSAQYSTAAALVGRFICSVTYFLGCLDRRVAQSPQQSSEILSREPPLERPGDGFIMPLKSQ